ncbi:nickel transport system permease protein [Paenibacillus cellulosilyticus]|uniref:Nickel transport system permease protein n=1 Tax=Paenibacillus cellulosilyticus TaxID=375489 RepID=A0A2V2YQP4_9BACL|nr:nickel/cobalt ABC transporter permease [Paenibacillus cellulosilyticus]PWV99348.1 nickel transport system permease protein [Paenibacillus cellulosilyticus]QKS45111.1 ABC transporter permease [Paenibacillus cellulosilyticus]
MSLYILKRIGMTVPLLIVISFLTFVLNHLSPMEPVKVILHAQGVPTITEELIAETKAKLGMDSPLLIQYMDWLIASLHFDFGHSYVTGIPVWSMLGPALLHTLKLVLVSSICIFGLSIVLGVICAIREGRWLDLSVRSLSFLLTAMPAYWLAALLAWYFAVKLDWLPTSGMSDGASYVLPVAVLVIGYAGLYFRIIRSSMLSHLNEDYVLYERACGIPESIVTLHVLRNAMQVAITVFSLAIPTLLGSTVVVENIFAWPGLGTMTINAILSRDFPIIQAYVLVLAVAFVLFNTLADVIHAAMNPRMRREH